MVEVYLLKKQDKICHVKRKSASCCNMRVIRTGYGTWKYLMLSNPPKTTVYLTRETLEMIHWFLAVELSLVLLTSLRSAVQRERERERGDRMLYPFMQFTKKPKCRPLDQVCTIKHWSERSSCLFQEHAYYTPTPPPLCCLVTRFP